MKKTLVALTLCLAANAAVAEDVRFINGDGSEITELCIAAAQSSSNLNELATKLGVTSFTKGDVICNGMALNKFARKYRTLHEPDTLILSFRKTDATPETELCYAAVTFNVDFEKLKSSYASKNNGYDKVRCNNMALDRFVEQYRLPAFLALASN